jgi:electron transport complex protein RnfE
LIDRPRHIVLDGLWRNNPGFCQLLGLCPLLAVTTTLANGLALGLATLGVLTISNLAVSLLRRGIHPAVRLPVFVLIIASLVTAVDLLMNAYFHSVHRTLGLFVPLIVTNCAIIGRAEAFASRQPVRLAVLDGLANGAGFALVLAVLGALREIIGQGTVFSGLGALLGSDADGFVLDLPFSGLLLALLPPGAFLCFGLLLASINWINSRYPRLVGGSSDAITAQTPAS